MELDLKNEKEKSSGTGKLSIDWKINCFSINQRLVTCMNKNILLLQLDTVIEFIDFLLESEEISEQDLTDPETAVIVTMPADENV
jgi:hypothetical protein